MYPDNPWCGVYRRFVANFPRIAKLLTALTSTKLPEMFPAPSREEMDAFEKLRRRLLDGPIFFLPKRHGHYMSMSTPAMNSWVVAYTNNSAMGNTTPSATIAVRFSLQRRTTSPQRLRR